eukprot:762424-Hanusia_phi.AAC.3
MRSVDCLLITRVRLRDREGRHLDYHSSLLRAAQQRHKRIKRPGGNETNFASYLACKASSCSLRDRIVWSFSCLQLEHEAVDSSRRPLARSLDKSPCSSVGSDNARPARRENFQFPHKCISLSPFSVLHLAGQSDSPGADPQPAQALARASRISGKCK